MTSPIDHPEYNAESYTFCRGALLAMLTWQRRPDVRRDCQQALATLRKWRREYRDQQGSK